MSGRTKIRPTTINQILYIQNKPAVLEWEQPVYYSGKFYLEICLLGKNVMQNEVRPHRMKEVHSFFPRTHCTLENGYH